MSSDTTDQWQMPLGALPFPPVVQDVNSMSFGSPNSFDDRSSSIGTIPSGGSHQAVRDVTEMVASSVGSSVRYYASEVMLTFYLHQSSSVTAAIKATSITSVFLDECLHMFFVRFIPTFPILHRATFVFRECTHPLLLNAMALGSLYLGPKDAVAKVSCPGRRKNHKIVNDIVGGSVMAAGTYCCCYLGMSPFSLGNLGHTYAYVVAIVNHASWPL